MTSSSRSRVLKVAPGVLGSVADRHLQLMLGELAAPL